MFEIQPTSQIRFTLVFNPNTEQLSIETTEHNIDPYYVDLCACLNIPIEFVNASFGIVIYSEQGEEILNVERPENNQKLVRTNQQFVEIIRLATQPNTKYTMYAWFNNGGNLFEINYEYNSPENVPIEEPSQ